MRGFDTLERDDDLPDPRLIELIRTPDPQIIERLGAIAADSHVLRLQQISSAKLSRT